MNYDRMRWDRDPLVARAIEHLVAQAMLELERALTRARMNERPLDPYAP